MKRRDFLKKTAITAGAMSLGSSILEAGEY